MLWFLYQLHESRVCVCYRCVPSTHHCAWHTGALKLMCDKWMSENLE